MRRFSTITWFLLIAFVLGIGLLVHRVGADPPVAQAPRQMPVMEEAVVIEEAPLNAKEIAKYKFNFEALRSDARLRDLAEQKLEAARTEFESRYKEFLVGRGTLDFLLGASVRYLESELALRESDADQVSALEKHWTFMRQCEEVNRERFYAGRIPAKDYLETKHYRLNAELRLVQVRTKKAK